MQYSGLHFVTMQMRHKYIIYKAICKKNKNNKKNNKNRYDIKL